jgi:hypothetical protein
MPKVNRNLFNAKLSKEGTSAEVSSLSGISRPNVKKAHHNFKSQTNPKKKIQKMPRGPEGYAHHLFFLNSPKERKVYLNDVSRLLTPADISLVNAGHTNTTLPSTHNHTHSPKHSQVNPNL